MWLKTRPQIVTALKMLDSPASGSYAAHIVVRGLAKYTSPVCIHLLKYGLNDHTR